MTMSYHRVISRDKMLTKLGIPIFIEQNVASFDVPVDLVSGLS